MNEITIKSKIYTVREKQVMLDSDLAELYKIETKFLNLAVKRNIERFPCDFMFQLTEEEFESLRLQIVTSSIESLKHQNNEFLEKSDGDILLSQKRILSKGGRTYLPYVFTEQGVAMLSGILRSEIAIKVNIQIMRTFIEMRHFLQTNSDLFQKISTIETKQIQYQIKTDEKFEQVFNLIQEKDIKPSKGIFYDGEIYQAHVFITNLISQAKESIILIDNYIDESVLTLFSQTNIPILIYTIITPKLNLAIKKYNQQYNNIQIKEFNKSHDRFLIIDRKEIYHIGASLKDLGKKWFAFSKFEDLSILDKL
ncbi:MAG: ORF6N domain-containing protein [Candidatus Woesearchaeota archaeon]